MINEEIKVGNIIEFHCNCEKCEEDYQREKEELIEEKLNNTEKSFCDDCTKNFIEWMKDKGYLKTDCWCKHIEEYKNANK